MVITKIFFWLFLCWLIQQYAQTVVCLFFSKAKLQLLHSWTGKKKLLMVECSWLISNFSVKSSISTFRSVNLIIFFLALNTSKLFVFSWFCCIYDFTEHGKFLTTVMCSHVRLTIITSNKCDYSWIGFYNIGPKTSPTHLCTAVCYVAQQWWLHFNKWRSTWRRNHNNYKPLFI